MPPLCFTAVLLLLASCGDVWPKEFNSLVQEAAEKNHTNQVGVVLETEPRGGSQSIGINWDRVVDLILDLARQDILKHDQDSVALPDIHEEFHNKVLLVPLKGVFTAEQGSLKSLSTVRRMGGVSVRREGSRFVIACPLGLATLDLKYDRYRAKVNHVGSVSGHVKGTVGGNSVRVTATLDLRDGTCTAALNEVKVLELEGLSIKASGSGFGPLNWLITKVTNSYAKNHKMDIIAKIEQGLTAEISKAMEKFHCEQYIGLLLL